MTELRAARPTRHMARAPMWVTYGAQGSGAGSMARRTNSHVHGGDHGAPYNNRIMAKRRSDLQVRFEIADAIAAPRVGDTPCDTVLPPRNRACTGTSKPVSEAAATTAPLIKQGQPLRSDNRVPGYCPRQGLGPCAPLEGD